MSRHRQPPSLLFLLLGIGSIGATDVYLVRAFLVEAIPERLVTAAVFAGLSVLWAFAYLQRRRQEP